jgi:hypothetical protein
MKNNRERHFMYFTIYRITNTINGKFYIGMHKTNNLDDGYFGSGKLIRRAIEKYGKDAFIKEYLFIFDNYEDMVSKEIELITEDLVKNSESYNLTVGGFGGNRIVDPQHHTWSSTHTKVMACSSKQKRLIDHELRDRLSKIYSLKLKDSHEAGKIRYDTFTGKQHTDATKAAIGAKNSERQKGSKNSQFGTKWITDGTENKKIPKEQEIPEGWRLGRTIKK